MPQGDRPQLPNGEQGTPPEMPEGMEKPEKPSEDFPQGERPEAPNGERPELPEGMTPPDNKGGMIGGNRIPNGETSATFKIAKGGNQFSNVGPTAS